MFADHYATIHSTPIRTTHRGCATGKRKHKASYANKEQQRLADGREVSTKRRQRAVDSAISAISDGGTLCGENNDTGPESADTVRCRHWIPTSSSAPGVLWATTYPKVKPRRVRRHCHYGP